MEENKSTEEQILAAAEKVFLSKGLKNSKISDIAELAGVNNALINYYFRTKEKLFDKIFEDKVRLLVANFMNVQHKDGSFEDKLKVMIESHFDFLDNNPKLPAFIYREMSDSPMRIKATIEKIKAYPHSMFVMVDKDLKTEIQKGTIREISTVDLLFTIISLNVMPFLFKPIFQAALNLSEEQIRIMADNRKKEIIETVLLRIKL